MPGHPVIERVERMFGGTRRKWQALWDTVYQYVAPERAIFFQGDRDPNSVMDRVYDSTAIDAAERLTNLIVSRLCPPWQQWFRIAPGPAVTEQGDRDAMRTALDLVSKLMWSKLSRSNFYQEIGPTVLDRIVGGTGGLKPLRRGHRLTFVNVPLTDIAITENPYGEINAVARRFDAEVVEVLRVYEDKLPDVWKANHTKPDEKVKLYELSTLDSLGQWGNIVVLQSPEGGITLESSITSYPGVIATRWSKIPGEPYGRGPGLRALSDVRALNRVKELTLKHAARVVGGVHTVVDDGVVNPYTLSLEPMTFVPVASNDMQNPSIRELPPAGDLNTAAFVTEDLRNAIKATFLADQFGPLDRTPMSATEVIERTRIIAQELGATVARLQRELLDPVLRCVLESLQDDPSVGLPDGVVLDDQTFRMEFVSQLAQAQWAVEEQQITEFTMMAIQLGEVDPKAGLVLDVHKTLRRVGEMKDIPADLLRSEAQIEALLEQAGNTMAQAEEAGVSLAE